jgi:hypothetical protein
MKININVKTKGYGIQIFDALYAFLQSLNSGNYCAPIKITIDAPYQAGDLNILYDNIPVNFSAQNLVKYDFIFFCNSIEPLQVATKTMADLLDQNNVYLLTNSYLTESHPLFHKVIWFPTNLTTCRDLWTRHFYPQYYENIKNRSIDRKEKLIAINGSVRTNRHYFFTLLQQHVPDISRWSQIGTTVHKLNDAQWESTEDTQFKNWVNEKYQDTSIPQPDQYHDSSPTIGIDGKFGNIPTGYFIMPEYFEYSCVIFPETNWQNNELAVTEKALKCFYAGSLPFPVGGSNINQLYNDLGFYTAWNLLPDTLKDFDQVTDHAVRYQLAVVAVNWLNSNRSVFNSNQFKSLIDQNRSNFLNCACEYNSIKRLHDLIKTKLNIDFSNKI